MRRVLIAAVLLVALAGPAAAQGHPCDDESPGLRTLVTPPFAVSFCSDEADVAGYEIVLDGVALPFPGPAVKSATANAAGFFAYESPATLTAAPGRHDAVVRVIDRLGRVSPSSAPRVALVIAGVVTDPQLVVPIAACTAPAKLAIRQCELVELAGAGFSINCSTRCADPDVAQPPPTEPAVCASAPLTVAVKLWPSTQVGKSATMFFQASQNVQSAVVAWVPRLTLAVTDTRGCTVTIAK